MFGTCKVLQLVSHSGTDAVRDIGMLCRNKMLQHLRIMAVNATRSVFLMSVVPVTSGPILPWFRTARCLPTTALLLT